MLVKGEKNTAILCIGAFALGFYKYVFGIADIMEEEGPPDIFIIFWSLSDGESTGLILLFSLISTLAFATVAILPVAFLTDVSLFLAKAWTFAPAVYCIVTAAMYFRDEY